MRTRHYKLQEVVFEEKLKHPRFKDLEGKKFNRLYILGFAGRLTSKNGSENKESYWWCLCDCGNIIKASVQHLKGHTTSCGCKNNESLTKHGMYKSSEYSSYIAAKARCTNSKNYQYEYYGARGIEFRFTSFKEFYDELGDKPEPKHLYSVDRINNDGHYEKGNVRWVTQKEQNRNRRGNHFLTYNHETKILTDWALQLNISPDGLYDRLYIKRWCIHCSLTIPPNKSTRGSGFVACSHIEGT